MGYMIIKANGGWQVLILYTMELIKGDVSPPIRVRTLVARLES